MSYRNYKWFGAAVLFFAVWTMGIEQAHATSCVGGLVNVWPASGSTIPTNGVILVEGYSNETGTILALAKDRPKLTSASGSVALDVVEVFRNKMTRASLVTAVLKPVKPLKPGVKYTLKLRHVDRVAKARILRSGAEPKPKPPGRVVLTAHFTAAKSADTQAPRWLKQPRISGALRSDSTLARTRGVRVQARASTAKQDQVYYVARVQRVKAAGDIQEYPILGGVARGEVYIGSDLCASRFVLKPDAEYKVTLQPVDWARNRGRRSRPVKITPETFKDAEDPFRRPTAPERAGHQQGGCMVPGTDGSSHLFTIFMLTFLSHPFRYNKLLMRLKRA